MAALGGGVFFTSEVPLYTSHILAAHGIHFWRDASSKMIETTLDKFPLSSHETYKLNDCRKSPPPTKSSTYCLLLPI